LPNNLMKVLNEGRMKFSIFYINKKVKKSLFV